MNTRQRILLEAVELFSRRGYEAVTVEMIAAAVGIRAPSLYKHFKSKRDIFLSVLQEMERRDAENAEAYSLPVETKESVPEAYGGVSPDALTGFCQCQFRYWTQDPFAAPFRRMLTVEQYRSEEMNRLYHQYLGAGPLRYTADLLGSEEEALALYGPMHFLYGLFDQAEDKEQAENLLSAHLRKWAAAYLQKTGRE